MAHIPSDFIFPKDLPPAAIAAFRALRPDDKYPDIDKIMQAVDYPDDPVGPTAESLTPAQRAAAEVITALDLYTSNNDIDVWMPRRLADRRRWLGLDAPGPLEKHYTFKLGGADLTEPGWRALKLLKLAESESDDDSEEEPELVANWLETVPLVERIAMWGVVNLGWPEVWELSDDDFFDPCDDVLIDQLGPEMGPWATRYADEVLAATAAGDRGADLPELAMLSLVRAGVALEPRWDGLLTLNGQYSDELVAAIPKARRPAAVLRALKRMPHPAHALRAAKRLLKTLPDPEIAAYAVKCVASSVGSERKHLDDLAAAVGKNAAALAVIDAVRKAKPAAITLTTTAIRDVAKEGAAATFSELEEAQLLIAGKRYFGKKMPLDKLLALDRHSEETLRHVLSKRTVADVAHKPVYEIWEYMGDSGTVFKIGGKKAVASIIQGCVECDDEALRDALEVAIRQRAPKAR